MKKNVKRMSDCYYTKYNGAFELKYIYFRRPKTFNEIKQNAYAIDDGYKVRGCRKNLPTWWDDIMSSQNYGRDWKRFTKKRKQWCPFL